MVQHFPPPSPALTSSAPAASQHDDYSRRKTASVATPPHTTSSSGGVRRVRSSSIRFTTAPAYLALSSHHLWNIICSCRLQEWWQKYNSNFLSIIIGVCYLDMAIIAAASCTLPLTGNYLNAAALSDVHCCLLIRDQVVNHCKSSEVLLLWFWSVGPLHVINVVWTSSMHRVVGLYWWAAMILSPWLSNCCSSQSS